MFTRRLFLVASLLLVALIPAHARAQAQADASTHVERGLARLLDSMEVAVLAGNPDACLALSDLSEDVFAQEQRNWAADLDKHAPETFELELGDEIALVNESEATIELTMTWNMPERKRRRVSFPARFTRGDDGWKYAGEHWSRVEGDLILALHADGLDEAARLVAEVWPEVRRSVNEQFGITPDDGLLDHTQQVKLYGSMAHLQASIHLSYADEHGGLAGWNEPGESIKMIARGRLSADRLRPLLSHEYGHVCAFAFGPSANTMPWWLLEGLAEAASAPYSRTRRMSEGVMRRVAARDNIAPWRSIADFENTPPEFAHHVYRQGHHMVMYVDEQFGLDRRNQWARAQARGQSLDEATRGALGISFQELDRRWRETLQPEPVQVPDEDPDRS